MSTGFQGTLGSLGAGEILSVPDGYLPQGHRPEFDGGRTTLTIPGGVAVGILEQKARISDGVTRYRLCEIVGHVVPVSPAKT